MSAYELASLNAQWMGSIAGACGVIVAFAFGYLTLLNSRRSKDAQERASEAAVSPPQAVASSATGNSSMRSTSTGETRPRTAPPEVVWSPFVSNGETHRLLNDSDGDAFDVWINGFTPIDQQRLGQVRRLREIVQGHQILEFAFVSRLSLSGPGNVIVSWEEIPGGARYQQIILVGERS